jgi:hypothetical protein
VPQKAGAWSRQMPVEASSFEAFHIRQQVMDLVGVKLELRHCRMAGSDALGERFGERFDRVALVQDTERRRDLERTLSDPIDRVAARAIRPQARRRGMVSSISGRPRYGARQIAA